MTSKVVMLGLAAALYVSASAEAQWFGPVWEENGDLTAEDRAIVRNTVQRDIHGKPADTVATWTNPASGHSGSITLLARFWRKAMQCEQIEYRIAAAQRPGRIQRYVFTSCQLPDGTWKLAD